MYACVHVAGLSGEGERLKEIAEAFSPQWEVVSAQTVIFPIGGLRHLYPSPMAVAEAITAKAKAMGLAARIGVAANPATAMQAALAYSGTTFIAPGEEAERLASLPLSAVQLPPDMQTILQRWGVRTLGELARLPEDGLVARLGQEGGRLRQTAQGISARPLVPEKALLVFQDTCVLEEAVENLEPLLFLLARSLEAVCTELARQSLMTDEVRLSLRLGNRAEYVRTHRLPVPTVDRKALLKLIQLDLAAHPPQSPVLAYTLLAQPANPRAWQGDLFAPPMPEPEKLEITLARLMALLGPEKVGSPEVKDSHRPDAWSLVRFTPAPPSKMADASLPPPVWALRRFRPALQAIVWLDRRKRPKRLEAGEIVGPVLAAAGPWPTSGAWWDEAQVWDREDWDVELPDRVIYRLFYDVVFQVWFVEGYYD